MTDDTLDALRKVAGWVGMRGARGCVAHASWTEMHQLPRKLVGALLVRGLIRVDDLGRGTLTRAGWEKIRATSPRRFESTPYGVGLSIVFARFMPLVLVCLLACARSTRLEPMTEAEQDIARCRNMARRACGNVVFGNCEATVRHECMALLGWSHKGGKLVKRASRCGGAQGDGDSTR